MIKNFILALTISLSAGLANAQTQATIFSKVPKHPALARIKPVLQLQQPNAAMRAAAPDARPDSMHYSSWDSSSNNWSLEEVSALEFDTNARLVRQVFYNRAGAGSIAVSDLRMSYTPAGKLASYSMNLILGGLNVEQLRFDFHYDVHGQKASSMLQVPDPLTNAMLPVFGDSVQYIRNSRNEITEAIHFFYDDMITGLGWIPIQRVSEIQTDQLGKPTAFTHWSWNDQQQNWEQPTKVVDVAWDFGWRGWESVFGMISLDEQFSVYIPSDFSYTEPTNYISYQMINQQWVPQYKAKAELDGNGRPIRIRELNYNDRTQSWEDSRMIRFSYFGQMLEEMMSSYFDQASMTYEPENRLRFQFDAGMGFMSERQESWHNGLSWQHFMHNRYQYQHNASGKPTQGIVTEVDGNNHLPVSKNDYFYRPPVAASASDFSANAVVVRAFPNPTQNELRVKAENTTINLLQLRNMNGQLVMSKKADTLETNELVLQMEALPAGMYLLEIFDAHSKYFERIIKN
jgi:hypothetical protein